MHQDKPRSVLARVAAWIARGLAVLVLAAGLQASAETSAPARQVTIELFGEAGCEACAAVRVEVLPGLTSAWGDRLVVVDRDVFEQTNYVALAAYQDRFGIRRDDPVSVVVDGIRYLGGVADIRRDLAAVVQARMTADTARAVSPSVNPAARAAAGHDVVRRRFESFAAAGVAFAGLSDGVNPCAFATVIFLASLLAMARARGADVLLMGGAYLVATFLTYFLLGLGLLRVLKELNAWHWAARVLNGGMAAALLVLAALSFRDAWRFARTGKSADVTLRMPDALRRRVHGMLRDRITPAGLASGGFVAGVLVTLIESVCTGQVYVPTLQYVMSQPALRPHALGLLALYNLAFLVPVFVVMMAAWRGTTSITLAEWGRRNVVWGKALMGLLFLCLGALILLA